MRSLFKSFRSAAAFVSICAAITLLLSPLAILVSSPGVARADVYGSLANFIFRGVPAGGVTTAVSTDVTLVVKYVGATSGTVAVASNGDLTFSIGAVGASAVDTTIKCPSGGSSGVIDVSDTACDTLGEVVDIINASSTFRAVILDGLRSDSSNDTLLTISETAANAPEGLNLVNDTAVTFTHTKALVACRDFTCGWIQNRSTAAPPLIENPEKGLTTVIWKSILTSTYGSGTSTVSYIDVDVHNKPSSYGGSAVGSETVKTLWSQTGGTSTTALTLDSTATGFFCIPQHKCLVRILNSLAMTVPTDSTYAMQYPSAPSN